MPEMIEVPGVGDRPPRKLSRQALADVIEPRVCELYELVQAELRRSGYEELLSSGIVLSGGRPSCRAWSNWAKRFSTCRCVSAIRNMTVRWPTWCEPR
jgi:cell division protein FtsA